MSSVAEAVDTWEDVVHTGPGTLAGRYLRSFWQPVYRGQDLAAGSAVPLRVMSEDFTLYRGQGGHAHLVDFRCAHRGTQLSTGWVEDDCIRCFYHGWKYGPDGQCVEQPAEADAFAGKVRIRAYPTREYLGLVFAYLGEGQAPPLPRYPEFEVDDPRLLRVVGPQVWPCNYFNRLENSLDHVHGSFVHRRRVGSYGLYDVPAISGEETSYGIKTVGLRHGHRRVMHYHMPNVNYRTPWAAPTDASLNEVDPEGGSSAQLAWRLPVTDDSCASFVVARLAAPPAGAGRGERDMPRRNAEVWRLAGAILHGDLRVADVADPTIQTNVEDFVAQVGQGAIADRHHERLGRSDVLVILLRKLWSRELRALAEGRELTAWRRPAEPLEVSTILE